MVVEMLCRRVRVVVEVGLLRASEVAVVVVVVGVVASEVSSVTSPFSAFLLSMRLQFSLLQVRTLCWINLTISANANSFLQTPHVSVSPPTDSGSAVKKKKY